MQALLKQHAEKYLCKHTPELTATEGDKDELWDNCYLHVESMDFIDAVSLAVQEDPTLIIAENLDRCIRAAAFNVLYVRAHWAKFQRDPWEVV